MKAPELTLKAASAAFVTAGRMRGMVDGIGWAIAVLAEQTQFWHDALSEQQRANAKPMFDGLEQLGARMQAKAREFERQADDAAKAARVLLAQLEGAKAQPLSRAARALRAALDVWRAPAA